MKILMAPVNIAGQPIQLVEELRRQGVAINLMQYGTAAGHSFGYHTDILVDPRPRPKQMLHTLKWSLEEGFDIYHFWQRSLLFYPGSMRLTGLDLPFLKVRGKKILYRFTGFDLRLKTEDMQKNRFSPFHYGYEYGFEEDVQKRYIEFLEQYVDQFIVQDPELQDFYPRAKIIPRVMNIEEWPYVGVGRSSVPLVVHAPSSKKVKGSEFVEAAVEELQSEGLRFQYKTISGMSHAEAQQWYKKADIVIDQLLIGWYGVLTLEAMALGKPVIVYVREELLDRFEHELPIENANPDTIKETLRTLIKDNDRRIEKGRMAREFVEKYHDVKKVAGDLLALYQDVLQRESSVPSSYADIDYFGMQMEMMQVKPSVATVQMTTRIKVFLASQHKWKKIVKYMRICFATLTRMLKAKK